MNESDLFYSPMAPAEAPQYDQTSYGFRLTVSWGRYAHKDGRGWQVAVPNLKIVASGSMNTDSIGGGRQWQPGQCPTWEWVPIEEYLKKLEGMFGINNA